MNTKVKGDKIKEGSIPLSALADDVKGEFDGKYGYKNCKGVLNIHNAIVYAPINVYYIYSTDYNKSILLNPGSTVNLNSMGGPSINITSEIYEGNNVKISIDDTSSVGAYGNLYVYQYHKSPTFPTPDWNAQKGEAGYIENKPFTYYDTIYNFSDGIITDESIYDNDGNAVSYRVGIEYEFGITVFKEANNKYDDSFRITAYQETGPYRNRYEGNCFIETIEKFSRYKLIIEMNEPCGYERDWKFVYDPDLEITVKQISDIFIPDTVIKTTYQQLSTTDKNQALANLGITNLLPYYIEISNVQDWNGVTYNYDQLVELGINSNFLQGKYKNCFVDLNTNEDSRHIILPMSHYEYDDQGLLRAVFGRIMGEEDFEMLVSFEIAYDKDSNIYTLSSYIG